MTHPTGTQLAAHVLAEAATTGGYAPSIRAPEPWRWHLTTDTLELRLAPQRITSATHPEARVATSSCGAALHHAYVTLRARGWRATITRRPRDGDADLLARVRITGREPDDPASLEFHRLILLRHTDRRPIIGMPIDPVDLAAIVAAMRSQEAELHTLRADQVLELASTTYHAQRIGAAAPSWQVELAAWAGGPRPAGSGIPEPAPSPGSSHSGTSSARAGRDTGAVFVVLFGHSDDPVDWLRAGEALSAGWLTAIGRGVVVVPYSAPIEVVASRQAMRSMIASVGNPYLLLRLSRTDPGDPGCTNNSTLG